MKMSKEQKSESSSYLTGKLLLAMPGMGDFRFQKAVIYLCAHDKDGAMGLVINQPLADIDFSELLKQLDIKIDIAIDKKSLNIPVMNGGPVEGARGFLLHSNEFEQDDTVKVDDNIYVTGTLDALKDVAEGKGPQEKLFILGYAGWTAGQLDQELQQNAWLTVDADNDLVFHGNPEHKWEKSIQKLGIDPTMLSMEGGRA